MFTSAQLRGGRDSLRGREGDHSREHSREAVGGGQTGQGSRTAH